MNLSVEHVLMFALVVCALYYLMGCDCKEGLPLDRCGGPGETTSNGTFDYARCASDLAFAECHASACAGHRAVPQRAVSRVKRPKVLIRGDTNADGSLRQVPRGE
jgi:hypothetical protein